MGDVWVGFLEAGPEVTPGLRPVWVLGEPLPELPDDDDEDVEEVFESFVRVLLIVIFMPSELCLTMYSAGFFESIDGLFLLTHLPSTLILLEEVSPRSF